MYFSQSCLHLFRIKDSSFDKVILVQVQLNNKFLIPKLTETEQSTIFCLNKKHYKISDLWRPHPAEYFYRCMCDKF